jgi:hypothetical protein
MQHYFDASVDWASLLSLHPGFGVTRKRYDPLRVRQKLLSSSAYHPERVVKFLYRPFDVRWLYWEPQHKLLNEPRRELIPYWLAVPSQRCLVIPLTPRRKGAFRPVVSSCVASFAAAEPDARLFPLYAPGEVLHGAEGQLGGDQGASVPTTLVAPEWLSVVRKLGIGGDDRAVGDLVFHALVCIMNSPGWIADHPTEADDFPPVALPDTADLLIAAAVLGKRIAALNDPTITVLGVTAGSIEPAWASTGIPDLVNTSPTLEFGRFGVSGGLREGESVLWDAQGGWRNIPEDVWSFTACGHAVLPKWLAYRVRSPLTHADRETFMQLCRRIAALRTLEPACQDLYLAASATPLAL